MAIAIITRFSTQMTSTVPASWLITWVAYSISSVCLTGLPQLLNTLDVRLGPTVTEYLKDLTLGAGISAMAHVIVARKLSAILCIL